MNSHPLIREFALNELHKLTLARYPVGLFIRNFQAGDEQRFLNLIELPAAAFDRHSLVMDLLSVLEENADGDAALLGPIAYVETPCAMCRFRALKLMQARQAMPAWIAEECRHDSEPDCREFAQVYCND